MDFVLAALPALLAQGAQLAVLGAGEPELASAFARAEIDHPGRIALVAAMDGIHWRTGCRRAPMRSLVPSRFEPLRPHAALRLALRGGARRVRVGGEGLADTVIDANEAALEAEVATGIMLPAASPEGAARRAEEDGSAVAGPERLARHAARRHGNGVRLGKAGLGATQHSIARWMEHPGRD